MAVLQDDGSIKIEDGRIVQLLTKEVVQQFDIDKSLVVIFVELVDGCGVFGDLQLLKQLYKTVERYKSLKQQLDALSTGSTQDEALKIQITSALETGEFDGAEQLLKQLSDNNLGSISSAQANAANGLLARTRYQFDKAADYYKQAAQTLLALGSEYELQAADYLSWAGRGFHDDQAQSLSEPEQALVIRERLLGVEHLDVATTLNDIAGFYNSYPRNENERARPLYEQALAIREKALGAYHPAVAKTLVDLAWTYSSHNEEEERRPLYERALTIQEQVLDKNHPDLASTLGSLALTYWSQRHQTQAKAQVLYERILKIQEYAFGLEHTGLIKTLGVIASLLYEQQNFRPMPLLYERALSIAEKMPYSDHVLDTLGKLSDFYFSQADYVNAQHYQERILALAEPAYGTDSCYTAGVMLQLAEIYNAQHQFTKAQAFYEKSVDIAEKLQDMHLGDKVIGMYSLAEFYQKQGEYRRAEALLHRILAISKEVNFDITMDLFILSELYTAMGEHDKAEEYYQRALVLSDSDE